MPSPDQADELLQLISEGFVFVDRDFRILAMNAEGERIEGRPAAEITGTTLWESWPDVERSELGELWRKAMRDRQPVALEHRYTWPDGRQAWLEMRAFPSEKGMAIFFRDISRQKRSEEDLKRAQAELLHASRLSAMGTMAATLAHELAQPLNAAGTAIEGSLRMLRPLPAAEAREAKRALEQADGSVRRASEILKRLRAFVAKRGPEPGVHELPAIIADVGVLMLPHAQREGVEIDFRLDRRAKWVKADEVQVQQVLINLIRNSIEAMAGVKRRRITVSTAPVPPASIEVAVADTGPGLQELSDEEAFAPFRSTKREGLGVGLSISRTIVEAHGGTIEARRPEGGGALFRFTLPRGAPD